MEGRRRVIDELASEYWEQSMRASPVTATALGDRRFDDRLSDVTPEGRARLRAEAADLRARVAAVDPEDLEEEDRVTRGELLGALDRDLDQLDCGLEDWTVSPMAGPQTFYLNIPDVTALRSVDEVEAYLSRVGAMATQLDDVCANLERSLGEGKVANRKAIERSLDQVETILAQPVDEWRLYTLLEELPEELARAPSAPGLRDRLHARLADELAPAFERFGALLRERLLPAARPDETPGLMHVPDGEDAYARMIRLHTTLDLDAEAIHAVGLEEIARLEEEIVAIGREALGCESFADLQAHLRSEPEIFFDGAPAIEAKARAAVERAEGALDGVFGLRPATPCGVRPIPPHEAPHSPIAYYRQPAADGSRPGVYYVNTHAPETRPRFEAEVLAFHEAVPGHHLQIEIAQGLEALPEFRRHGHVTSYVEGWALYTERLADEMGLYSSPLDRIGMLSFDLWRSGRLVVDTGMHALGWSRQRAIDFMVANTVLAENNIENEIDRYVVMPGQALSYKLGQREFFRLRDHARERLGERFTLPGFHDVVLRHGAVSLPVLERLVETWEPA